MGLLMNKMLTWDYNGLDDAIDEYEVKIIEEVIGKGRDFEVSRFSHAPHNSPSIYINTTTGQIGNGNSQSVPGQSEATFANYEFYFYSGGSINDLNNWEINYLGEGFSPQDLYYYSNSFTNSFFKLDLYDTPDEKRQTNYVTLIIPTQQGLKMDAQMQRTVVSVHKPEFVMTGRGWDPSSSTPPCQQQWPSYLTIDKTLGPQACMSAGERFTFDNTQYFYYTVQLDYPTQTYQIYNTFGQRVGTNIPIKWYEYINP